MTESKKTNAEPIDEQYLDDVQGGFDAQFGGGVSVAAGDVNGDGRVDLNLSSGTGDSKSEAKKISASIGKSGK